jgi:hypothetical protein
MNKILVLLISLLFFTGLSQFCLAKSVLTDEVIIKSISPSPYYDSRPCVWDNYVVWRRAVNQNNNEYIELKEPSWIMVYNIKTNKAYNITPILTFVYENKYHHAESPDIYKDKIIYEAQVSGNSSDTKLFIYDISTKKTVEVPLLSSKNAHGHLHLIYDTWIAYTDKMDGRRQAYLYNYESGIYRTILGVVERYSVYGMTMNSKSIILTVTGLENKHEIWKYDIESTRMDKLLINNTNAMATSIYDNTVGVVQLNENETAWDTYLYDSLTGNSTLINNNTDAIIMSSTEIVYESNNTLFVIEKDGTNMTEIPSYSIQHIGDIYENTLVWIENSNSNMSYNDARDNFDIYIRTVITTEQKILEGIYILFGVIGAICLIAYSIFKYNVNINGD